MDSLALLLFKPGFTIQALPQDKPAQHFCKYNVVTTRCSDRRELSLEIRHLGFWGAQPLQHHIRLKQNESDVLTCHYFESASFPQPRRVLGDLKPFCNLLHQPSLQKCEEFICQFGQPCDFIWLHWLCKNIPQTSHSCREFLTLAQSTPQATRRPSSLWRSTWS